MLLQTVGQLWSFTNDVPLTECHGQYNYNFGHQIIDRRPKVVTTTIKMLQLSRQSLWCSVFLQTIIAWLVLRSNTLQVVLCHRLVSGHTQIHSHRLAVSMYWLESLFLSLLLQCKWWRCSSNSHHTVMRQRGRSHTPTGQKNTLSFPSPASFKLRCELTTL